MRKFAEQVITILEANGKKAKIREVQKNNSVKIGIETDTDKDVRPTFYMDNFKTPEQMADFILNFKGETPDMTEPTRIMQDRNEILNRVTIKLINSEKNKNSDKAEIELNNGLKVQFAVQVLEEGSITITKEIMNGLNLTEDQLYEAARNNIKANIKIESMASMLMGLMPFDMPDMPEGPQIITNKKGYYGASSILVDGVKDILTEKIGAFFILPSSVHEVIAVPRADIDNYRNIIMDVNRSVLAPEDFLSDDVFLLADDGILTIA